MTVPRAAYIHVPFCAHRCGYCNFTVIAGRDELADPYLDALECELVALAGPHIVDTLFVGGGTPTHLTPRQLERLVALLDCWFPRVPHAEYSFECNPGDLTEEAVMCLAGAGVNRVSLGAQSFDPAKLAALDRSHGKPDIVDNMEMARGQIGSVSLRSDLRGAERDPGRLAR